MRKFKVVEHDGLLYFYGWDQSLPKFEEYGKMMGYCAELIVDTTNGEVLKNRYGPTVEKSRTS